MEILNTHMCKHYPPHILVWPFSPAHPTVQISSSCSDAILSIFFQGLLYSKEGISLYVGDCFLNALLVGLGKHVPSRQLLHNWKGQRPQVCLLLFPIGNAMHFMILLAAAAAGGDRWQKCSALCTTIRKYMMKYHQGDLNGCVFCFACALAWISNKNIITTMYHLSSPQKWPMEIGHHKWPLKAIVIPRAKPEGYNWSFLGSRVVTKFHWSRVRTRQMSLYSF